MEQLLIQYDVAFGEPTGLDRTDMVLHTINTADAKPFKIPYRRLPLKKKLLAEKELYAGLTIRVLASGDEGRRSRENSLFEPCGSFLIQCDALWSM